MLVMVPRVISPPVTRSGGASFRCHCSAWRTALLRGERETYMESFRLIRTPIQHKIAAEEEALYKKKYLRQTCEGVDIVRAVIRQCEDRHIRILPKGDHQKHRIAQHRMPLRVLVAWCPSRHHRILSIRYRLQRFGWKGVL